MKAAHIRATSEDIEDELNKWLKDNEENIAEILQISTSTHAIPANAPEIYIAWIHVIIMYRPNQPEGKKSLMSLEDIVHNLIINSPVLVKADPITRQETNGPTTIECALACFDCGNLINLSFDEGHEATWQSDAQAMFDQHLAQFHKREA